MDTNQTPNRVSQPINPIYNKESKILILGSFPSVKSREVGFFYSHPQNRFWKVISTIYRQPLPITVEEKIEFLLRNQIAVWDVIYSCEITGSSDSSIKNVVPVDLSEILQTADIKGILTNGGIANQLYKKYLYPVTGREAIKLPSTSPANASFSLDKLVKEWSEVIFSML